MKKYIRVKLQEANLNGANLKQFNLSKVTLKVTNLDKKEFTEVSTI
ncbi:pentapeptide repeat-containing protein [cyanobacterium endosymbiont of Rhopalodia gibberula]